MKRNRIFKVLVGFFTTFIFFQCTVFAENCTDSVGDIIEGVENSWRYEDGEKIENENPQAVFSLFEPWSKVNGYFVNDKGEKIEGALKKGIDVSKWQGVIDWNKVKSTDIDYAIIRCGYGMNITSQDDSYWKRNADECTRLGIPFGTYIYSYADTLEKAKSEAEHVLRLVSGYQLEYPIYYDLEENGIRNKLSKSEIGQIAQVFCDTIEDAGYEVGIYANKDWFQNYLTDPVFDDMRKWVAQYNSVCTYDKEYEMWQSTSSGIVDGISGKVDLNFDFGVNSIEVPKPVENLKASSYGANKVLLSWTNSNNADGYLVYGIKDGKYGYVGMTKNGLSYVDTKASDTQYNFYWVFPYVMDRNGKMIPSACNKYVYAKGIVPAVQQLKATSVVGGVKLTWNSSVKADGYLIYGIVNGNKYGYVGMTTKGMSFTDKNASKEVYNYYWVYPYHLNNGKMIIGGTSNYTYGRAL